MFKLYPKSGALKPRPLLNPGEITMSASAFGLWSQPTWQKNMDKSQEKSHYGPKAMKQFGSVKHD